MKDDSPLMNRSEFIKLSSGLISSLALPMALEGADPSAGKSHAMLDDSYLEKGLTGMVKSNGWFDAHWGASVLAGYYLCRENQIAEETVAGIKKQLDIAIKIRGDQFIPLPAEPADENAIPQVSEALRPAMKGGLRAHGHAVIFASLSTRALRDAPHMSQPALINKLCSLSRQIGRKPPITIPSAKPYQNSQEMIEATFDSMARFKDVLGHPSVTRPNFTHMTTHAEALLNFELMGFPEIAKEGYQGHRIHITEEVPEIPVAKASERPASLEILMDKEYWNNPRNMEQWKRAWAMNENPNGYWIAAGHLFKVLYSYHRLIKRVNDKEKVNLCSRILLERYLNPEVSGG